QLSCGTGGSFGVESVAGFTWHRWQLSRGIRRGHRRVVRVSHTPKMPTSRKSTMVSRLLANPSIQISHGPPGGRRERLGAIPLTRRRKTDKHVTNGVGGSKVEGPRTLSREPQS